MAKKPYRENIKKFSKQYLDETGKAVKLYSNGVEKIFSGNVDGKELPNRLVNFVKDDGDNYLRNVMQSGVDYYLAMTKASLAIGDKFIDSVLESPTATKRPSRRSSSPKSRKASSDDK